VRGHWHVGLGLLLTFGLLWPLVVAPYFSHDDNLQTMRIYEMNQCVVDWQIPCRWVPDLGGGYGYPEFNYYAPLPYYVGELYYAVTQNIIIAAKLTFASAFVLAFISMYLFASELWGKLGGSLSAIFYVFAPYHARNLFGRGAMGELWAVAWIPLVFWAFLRLSKKPDRWNALLLGVAAALLILSHNLTAMLVLGVLTLIAALQLRANKSVAYAKYLVFAGMWAFGLSAFYLLPVLFESSFVHLETLTLNESNYAEHFQGLPAVLLEKPWWSPDGNNKYQIGTVHLAAWLLSAIAAVILWRKNKELRFIVITSSVVIGVCIYMIHPTSQWIWDRVALLAYLQFPWRLLALTSIATATLAGASLLLARSQRGQVAVWSVLVGLVAIMNVGWFRPERFLDVTQADLLSGSGWDNLRMYAIWDFLPKSAARPPTEPASGAFVPLAGQVDVSRVESGSNWLRFNASSTAGATVEIERYDFPTWQVSIDGQPVVYGHDSESGLLQVELPPGVHSVEAHLRDTPVRTLADLVSAGAFAAAVVLGVVASEAVLLVTSRGPLRRRRIPVAKARGAPGAAR
jgi:hypothetical protein